MGGGAPAPGGGEGGGGGGFVVGVVSVEMGLKIQY